MPRSSRLKLSLAGTAAEALASLPLGITPASAAKVTEGTTSSIGVVEAASNASQFNLKTQGRFKIIVRIWHLFSLGHCQQRCDGVHHGMHALSNWAKTPQAKRVKRGGAITPAPLPR